MLHPQQTDRPRAGAGAPASGGAVSVNILTGRLPARVMRDPLTHLAAIGALRVVELPLAIDLAEILAVGAVDGLIGVCLAVRLARGVRRAAAKAALAGARRGRWTLHLADIAAIRAI